MSFLQRSIFFVEGMGKGLKCFFSPQINQVMRFLLWERRCSQGGGTFAGHCRTSVMVQGWKQGYNTGPKFTQEMETGLETGVAATYVKGHPADRLGDKVTT